MLVYIVSGINIIYLILYIIMLVPLNTIYASMYPNVDITEPNPLFQHAYSLDEISGDLNVRIGSRPNNAGKQMADILSLNIGIESLDVTRVTSVVPGQFIGPSKSPGTLFPVTDKRLLSAVCPDMSLQVRTF